MKRVYLIVVVLVVSGLYPFPVSRASQTKAKVSFNQDVAPLFFKHCAECHRAGEAAPISVLSYKDVRAWAKSICEKVTNRTMPPWHADPQSLFG